MGDDELNFTEDEARCWADDPRNQPRGDSTALILLVFCAVLLVALMTFVLASRSRASEPDAGRPESADVGRAPAPGR